MNHFFQEWTRPVNHLTEHNLSFPLHIHDAVELVHVAKGETTLTILQKKYRLNTGDFAVIFPGLLHGYDSSGHASIIHMTVFNVSQVQNFTHELEHFHPVSPVIVQKDLNQDILMSFTRLRSLVGSIDPRIRNAWLNLLMSYLLSELELAENTDTGDSGLIADILEYLSAHYTEPVTLESLSKELHVNKYYLSHTFSKKLNMSFSAYLNKLRVERAMMLLGTTDHSIESIGEMSGFETQRTFNRVFKKMALCTPREYRKHEPEDR